MTYLEIPKEAMERIEDECKVSLGFGIAPNSSDKGTGRYGLFTGGEYVRPVDDADIALWHTLISLAYEKEQLEKQRKAWSEDSAQDDTDIRELAKSFLTDYEVNGDSYGVPTIVDVVELIASKLATVNKQLDSISQLLTPNEAKEGTLYEVLNKLLMVNRERKHAIQDLRDDLNSLTSELQKKKEEIQSMKFKQNLWDGMWNDAAKTNQELRSELQQYRDREKEINLIRFTML